MYVAERGGLYAMEGLEVQPVVTGGTSETIRALLEERVEIGGCSPDELISAVARGADLVVMGGIINRPVSWIVGQPGLANLRDLRGRRIGVNQTRGSVSIVLRAALQDAGLGPGDYEQVAVGSTPAMANALREQRVDAAMLTAPFDRDLVRQGYSALLNVGELFPRYAFTSVNVRRPWLAAHEAEVAAFFRATRAAGDRIADPAEHDDVLRALEQGTGLGGAALNDAYETYRQPGVLSRHGEVDVAALEAVLAQMSAQDLLPPGSIGAAQILQPRWSDGPGGRA